MIVEVRVRNCQPKDELRDHAERRVCFRLSRFGTDIELVDVSLMDVNGPKGGIDKSCSIRARGSFTGTINVQEVSADPFAAVDAAVDRLARSLGRALERRRAVATASHKKGA